VEVCFLNSSGDPAGEQYVQEAVQSNFKMSSTGIEFFGFTPCLPGSRAEAKIFFGVGRAYSHHIGRYKVQDGEFGETIGLPAFAKEGNHILFYNTALHEFGHFAGLFHEQSHDTNRAGNLCSRQESGGLNEIWTALPGSFPVQSPTFDRMSIMSYCVQGYSTRFLQLSDGDRATLRTLYGTTSPLPPPPVEGNRVNDETMNESSGSSNEKLISETVTSMSTPRKNLAELCNIAEILPRETVQMTSKIDGVHSTNGLFVPAFWRVSSFGFTWSDHAGDLAVGSIVSRLYTMPLEIDVLPDAENTTAMQVIPQSGPLAGQTVWILGNVTRVVDCRPE
jgi:hypothetical protein